MTTAPDIAKGSNIKIDDLLVGEHEVMNVAAGVWGLLYKMKLPYLKSFIARMENDTSEMSEISLPMFKLVAFFSEQIKEHTNKDERLLKALDDAKVRARMRQMFGMEEE